LGQIWYKNQFRARSGILIISGQIWQKSGLYWVFGANMAKIISGQFWLKTGQFWLKTGQIWVKIGAELG